MWREALHLFIIIFTIKRMLKEYFLLDYYQLRRCYLLQGLSCLNIIVQIAPHHFTPNSPHQ